MTVTGKRAVQAVLHAMEEAGLGRTSKMSGGSVTGWIPRNHFGSTGFSVKPTPNQGEVAWHVVISGKPHLSYRSWTERDEDRGSMQFHEPRNPESLLPRIKAAFETLGLDVRSVSCGGFQTHWDDDVSYNVVTDHPEWLERYNPDNRRQNIEAPLLAAVRFKENHDPTRSALSPVTAPLAAYIIDGSPYLTRESVEYLAATHTELLARHGAETEKARTFNAQLEEHNKGVRERNERGRKDNPAGFQPERERFPVLEPRWEYGEMSLSEDGTFHVAARGRGEHVCTPVEVTNHWGDSIETWSVPSYWMERLDTFAPVVPVLVDGEMRETVPFPVIDAQYGDETPWCSKDPMSAPGMK